MQTRVRQLITQLELQPHPEGGHFNEVYRSRTSVLSPVCRQPRNSVTDIYFLLQAGETSRWHRVVHDEIYHFYEGDPLKLFVLSPDFRQLRTILLGAGGEHFRYKYHVPGGHWQASVTTGEYSLVGCTVAPGFDFQDFFFLRDDGDAVAALQANHLQLAFLL